MTPASDVPQDVVQELARASVSADRMFDLLDALKNLYDAAGSALDGASKAAESIRTARARGVSPAELRAMPEIAEIVNARNRAVERIEDCRRAEDLVSASAPHTVAALERLHTRFLGAIAVIDHALLEE